MTFGTIRDIIANNGGSFVYNHVTAIPGTLRGLVVSGLQSDNKVVYGVAVATDFIAKAVFNKYTAALGLVVGGGFLAKAAFDNVKALYNGFDAANKKESIKANASTYFKTVGEIGAAAALVLTAAFVALK